MRRVRSMTVNSAGWRPSIIASTVPGARNPKRHQLSHISSRDPIPLRDLANRLDAACDQVLCCVAPSRKMRSLGTNTSSKITKPSVIWTFDETGKVRTSR